MQMISSRTISFLDDQTLEPGTAREVLFRDDRCGFILYLSDDFAEPRDKVVRLGAREALLWLDRMSVGDEQPTA